MIAENKRLNATIYNDDKNGHVDIKVSNNKNGAVVAEDVVEKMKNTYSQAMLNKGYGISDKSAGTKSENTGKTQANNALSTQKIDIINNLNSKEYFKGKNELNLSNEEFIKRQNDIMINSVSDEMVKNIDNYRLTADKRIIYVNEKGEIVKLELNGKIKPECIVTGKQIGRAHV